MPDTEGPSSADFSFGKMVAYSLGAATGVIIVAAVIILFVAQASPTAALVIALIAVVAVVAVIAIVSRRMMAGVQADIDRRRARAAGTSGTGTSGIGTRDEEAGQ